MTIGFIYGLLNSMLISLCKNIYLQMHNQFNMKNWIVNIRKFVVKLMTQINLFQHRVCLRVADECGQGCDSISLPGQSFKPFLLFRRFLLRPISSCITCNRFNPPHAGSDGGLSQDPE